MARREVLGHRGRLAVVLAMALLSWMIWAVGNARAAYPVARNGQIVFDRYVGGTTHIWLMNADGTNPHDISPANTFGDEEPQFSPDGRWIAFTRWMDNTGGLLHIFLMHPDGSGAVDLTPGLQGAGGATFSPDGHQIAFAMDTNPNPNAGFYSLAIMNSDGSGIRNLTPDDESFELRPDFSPDGTQIVFDRSVAGGTEIWAIAPDGSNPRPLSPQASTNDESAAFSPRGDRIAFSRDSGSNEFHIFVGDTALGGAMDLTPTGPSYKFKQRPAFSPDATRIAFNGYGFGPDTEIFSVAAGGGAPQDLSLGASPTDEWPHWEYIYMCGKRRATIVGDDGPETIKGTKKADVIVGNGGNDTIKGRGGNDRLCGGSGRDTLIGGAGRKDRLIGGPGKDKIKQ